MQTGGAWQMLADFLRDARYARSATDEEPRVHRGRDPDARARHRRHQRDVQRRQRRAAAAAAVSRAGSAACASTRSCRSTAASPSRRRRSSTGAQQNTVVRAASPRTQQRLGHASPAANGAERIPNARCRGTCSNCCACTRCSAGLHGGRRHAGQEQRRRPQPRHVAAAVRRRSATSSGRSMTLNGAPATIVGVMPPDFYFPGADDRVLGADCAQSGQRDRAAATFSASSRD